MKKFNATKMMALLMALCLITSTFVGSTLAKYTTQAEGADTARVAKFGVEITANGGLFADSYKYGDTVVAEAGDNTSVVGKDGAKVVAPGTKGDLAKMTLKGTPEVDVKVTYAAELTLENWTVDSNDYCPLEITVNGTTYKKDTMAELKSAVETAINGYSKEYKAGTDLATVAGDSVAVSWAWAFEGNDDVKDTALGDAATPATIDLKITTTVTQID